MRSSFLRSLPYAKRSRLQWANTLWEWLLCALSTMLTSRDFSGRTLLAREKIEYRRWPRFDGLSLQEPRKSKWLWWKLRCQPIRKYRRRVQGSGRSTETRKHMHVFCFPLLFIIWYRKLFQIRKKYKPVLESILEKGFLRAKRTKL